MSQSSSGSFPPLVLVTGATGFTGGALGRELLRRGARVRCLVRDPTKAQGLAAVGAELVVGDIRDEAAVNRAATGCGIIYHIAAAYRVAGQPEVFYREVNVDGTAHVLAAARRHGVGRVVHCSTVGVHGGVEKLPGDESAPFRAGDVYQETKLQGERLAQSAIMSGDPVSIFRPAGIYGPGDMRFLKLFKTINQGTFRMFGDGKVAFHLVYIDDLVDGIIRCGEAPRALGETFILCGAEYGSLNRLVESIAEVLDVSPPRGHLPLWPLMTAARICEVLCRPFGVDPPLHRRRCAFFTKARGFTCAKASRLIGYAPQVSLYDGLRRTADWYRAEGLLPARTRRRVSAG